MPPAIDLTGQEFNRWKFVRRIKGQLWLCVCSCGTEKVVNSHSVKVGTSKSCGCYNTEVIQSRAAVAKRLFEKYPNSYRRWANMIQRCTNKNNGAFHNYGGRGISVCSRWLNSFENFFSDMGEPPFDGASIDRENNDGNYSPSNCRWATKKEQRENTRSTRRHTHNGKTQSIKAWARELGIHYMTLYYRLVKMKLTVAEAVAFHR